MICSVIVLVLVTTSSMARARTLQNMDKFELLDYLLDKRTCVELVGYCSSNSQCCDGLTCYDTAIDAGTASGYYPCGKAVGDTPVGHYDGSVAPDRCTGPDFSACTCMCFQTPKERKRGKYMFERRA
ncbi:unnamed protein product [Adineta steineri]|uniref:Uncharacterized protein n=1 Tax=Adineta steineri TaxID=433720 RepID=A0A818J7F5_9BILA|nr:unnamed protein product [Adineta steineri]CAF1419266.1 unnamed protein product [Adineta steineri]CAF1430192.1 unnamed protein product [Adineta steineri]CAF3539528.1 unnamed protein product [Adineta steineri]CAF3975137.1 unnamed protein product [Adineta steineri]